MRSAYCLLFYKHDTSQENIEQESLSNCVHSKKWGLVLEIDGFNNYLITVNKSPSRILCRQILENYRYLDISGWPIPVDAETYITDGLI